MGLVSLRAGKLLIRARVFGALVALLPGLAYAEVSVTLRDGRLDIKAAAAPLSEILSQLASQTGMKILSDGPIPSMILNVSLEDRMPIEAVFGVLDGLGLNYALATDSTGMRVETLVISGAAARRPDPPSRTTPLASSYRVESPTQPALSPPPPQSIAVDEEPEEPEAASPLADGSMAGIGSGMAIAAPQEPVVSPSLPGTPSSAGHPLGPASPERGLEISPLQPRFKVPGGPKAEPPR